MKHHFAALAAILIPAAIATSRGDSRDAAIRRTLGITAYTVQTLDLPAGDHTKLALHLGDADVTADLDLDPVDTADCRVLVDVGEGPMQDLPPPAPVTYRGPVRDQAGSVASGSIIAGQFTGIVVLPGGAWNVYPLSQIEPGAARGLHVVSRFEDSVAGPWRCGVDSDLGARPTPALSTSGGTDTGPLYCELAIEADYPYFLSVGGTTSSVAQDISTVVANATSYAMLSGCNLKFRIVRYVIRATAQANPGLYNVTDPNTLLSNFRTVWNNLAGTIPRDTAHMFTGKDLDGTTIGIAYLSCVCNSTFAYGLSQSRFSLQPGRRAALTAHELGHNFSANHCDVSPNVCTPCWLMLASQGSTTNQLTRYGCSTDLILNYAASRPCLGGGLRAECPADMDGDGRLTPHDLIAFQNAFAQRLPSADADHNGRLNVLDFVEFLNEYSAGCP
jgi:hypothetical protein